MAALAFAAPLGVVGECWAGESLRLAPFADDGPSAAAARIGSFYSDAVVFGWGALASLVVCIGGLVVLARWQRRRYDLALARRALQLDQPVAESRDVVIRYGQDSCSVSPSIFGLLGYTAEEMQAVPMESLIHPDDLASVYDAFQALQPDVRRADLTYRMAHRDGRTVWVDATFGLSDVGGGNCETVCTIRDVTPRHLEALELRLATKAAREALADAREANQAKSDFLASMSHEIRTPLNAIIGFADLLLAMSDLATPARRHAERIKGGGNALLTIVNDILDLSQAEAGAIRLNPRPFALPLLVDECLSLVEGSAMAKNLALRIELVDRFPTGLVGDEARVRQVLLNLLNNAIKFTQQGQVTLRIGYDRASGPSTIRFEVSDSGIGIAAEDLPSLFQRFHQVEGTIRRAYGGAGLGLAISKALVERMGGTIDVHSAPGVGSTFWFAVDMPEAPLALETHVQSRAALVRSLEILIVEDVAVNQELIRTILESQGHHVDVVGDGAEAIMAVEDKPYDLVLMDVQMPHVDGITATRAIRCLASPCRFVPIVAMTAAALKEQVAAARAAGMDDVLAKPLSLPALEAMLVRADQDRIREAIDPDAYDRSIADRLAHTIGHAKVRSMQTLLARSLTNRFTTAATIETIESLKAEAHASIAGAAMLGFVRFGSLCRAFIAADEHAAEDAYAAVRRELFHVVRTIGLEEAGTGEPSRIRSVA